MARKLKPPTIPPKEKILNKAQVVEIEKKNILVS